jgi:hypothetical protein
MLNKFIIEPADLAELSEAFEAAWVIVEAEKRIPLMFALAERDRLGEIVFSIWNANRYCDLAAKAAEQFLATLAPLAAERRTHIGAVENIGLVNSERTTE